MLRMTAITEGYADSAQPLDDVIKAAVEKETSAKKPIVIWLCDAEDDKTNDALEAKIFRDEKIALAMKRFTCLKGEIQTIPDERQMDKILRKSPIFYFYDPGGNCFSRLEGRRATSRSGFSGRVEKLWNISFEMRLKDYTKKMGHILDQMDRLEGEKQRLTAKMDRAADNAPKLKRLQREETKLKEREALIQKDEQDVLDALKIRAEFTDAPGESARK